MSLPECRATSQWPVTGQGRTLLSQPAQAALSRYPAKGIFHIQGSDEMLKRTVVGFVVTILASVAIYGADAAKGVLFPQMTPEKGTFEKPFGKLGEKPATPWSVTTVAAAVDGKPLPGKVATLVGE